MPLDLAPPEDQDRAPPPARWTAERYLAALHPPTARGQAGVMLACGDAMRARTYRPRELAAAAGPLVEAESYVTLNRTYGPRGRSRLAGLNAVWLDLDTYRIPELALRTRSEIAAVVRGALADADLPQPSFLVDSGRGYYCIWLLRDAAAAALSRWSAVMRALVGWARPLGADPACVDAARVLRLPESWHHGAGRQVAVVDGTARRHDFEALADAVWRATGRPTRLELGARGSRRVVRTARGAQSSAALPARPRGLPRRAFWRRVLDDLERLLGGWGGVVPVGRRDLWLHLWVTALGWTAPDADLVDRVVAKAASAAPGLTAREVRRTMSSTIRRAKKAAAGRRGPAGADLRYGYGGSRMAELLGIDRDVATALGLRQLAPADLRAERARAGRVARRRASGVLPRSIWLAANPGSRERPWVAEGISRATWYRRQKALRHGRRQARVVALLGGSTLTTGLVETGPDLLYGGVAQPSADTRRPEPLHQGPHHPNRPFHSKTPGDRRSHLRYRPENAPSGDPASAVADSAACAFKAPDGPARPESSRMPLIDPDIVAAAARRLPRTDLGLLTRIAVELAGGPLDRVEIGRRLGLDYDELERLAGWLRLATDGRTVLSLCEAPACSTRKGRTPRQGALFQEDAFAPPPASVGTAKSSIKKAVIDEAIRVMAGSGVPERQVRAYLGRLFRDNSFGLVAEAVHELARGDVVADPMGWIAGFMRRRSGGSAGSGAATSGRRAAGRGPAPRAEETPRPLATPEFLGISPARAAMIREQNSKLRLDIRAKP